MRGGLARADHGEAACDEATRRPPRAGRGATSSAWPDWPRRQSRWAATPRWERGPAGRARRSPSLYKGWVRNNFLEIQFNENTHVQIITGLLGANARPKPTYQNLLARDLNDFAYISALFENTGAGAYQGSGPAVYDPAILAEAASLGLVEAYQAGWLNTLLDRPIVPEGSPVAYNLTPLDVMGRTALFIASLNGGPPATYDPTPSPANDIAILNFALVLGVHGAGVLQHQHPAVLPLIPPAIVRPIHPATGILFLIHRSSPARLDRRHRMSDREKTDEGPGTRRFFVRASVLALPMALLGGGVALGKGKPTKAKAPAGKGGKLTVDSAHNKGGRLTIDAASPSGGKNHLPDLYAGSNLHNFREIQDDENDHVAIITKALGPALARPKPTFQGLEASNVRQFAQMSMLFENTGVGAYAGASPFINSKAHPGPGVVDRLHRGVPLRLAQHPAGHPHRPRAVPPGPVPLTQQQVTPPLTGPFIASLNGGPPPGYDLARSDANDINILNFALVTEYLEQEFYNINVPKFFG